MHFSSLEHICFCLKPANSKTYAPSPIPETCLGNELVPSLYCEESTPAFLCKFLMKSGQLLYLMLKKKKRNGGYALSKAISNTKEFFFSFS